MILESLGTIILALLIDFTLGDPKNKYHPTAWMGSIIAKLTPVLKNSSPVLEKIGGIFVIIIPSGIVGFLLVSLHFGIHLISPYQNNFPGGNYLGGGIIGYGNLRIYFVVIINTRMSLFH